MATNTLHIRVRSDGTRKVSRGVKSIAENANLASRQIFLMRRAIQTLFAAAGVRAGFRLIEQFTELNNKLKTVTSSTRELVSVRKRLLAVANESRTSMSATVQLYTRTTRALKRLGLSESKRLKFTSLLTKEATIGGATTIEATNAIRQLTQGMGAAGLKGEELRSVMEQLPTVGERIADFLGVAQSELRKLGEEGKLTGEVVVAAMLAAEDSIEAAFGETVPTVGASFEVFTNKLREFAGQVDEFIGGSRILSASLKIIGENLEVISAVLLVIAARSAFVFIANNAVVAGAAIVKATGAVKGLLATLLLVKSAAKGVPAILALLADKSAPSAAIGKLLAGGSIVSFGAIAAQVAAAAAAAYLLVKGLDLVAETSKDFINEFRKGPPELKKMTAEAAALNVEMLSASEHARRLNLITGKEKIAIGIKEAAAAYKELNREQLQAQARRDFGRPLSEDELLGVSEGIVQRARDAAAAKNFSFLPEELKGNEATQTAAKVAEITKRLEELRAAEERGQGTKEERANAFAVQREKMDELRGSVVALTEKLLAENAAFQKFGGDLEAISLSIAGATDAQVEAFVKAKNAQKDMVDAKKEADQARNDAINSREREVEVINRSISSLREQIRLFGLEGRAREAARFAELPGTGPSEINEFQELQNILGRKQTEADAQASVTALRQEIQRFAEMSAELKKLAAGAPPKQAAEITALLKKGQAQLDEAARTLAERLATEVGASASTMVEEARTVLVAGGTKIGTAVGTAFSSAFKAALAGAIPGLSALIVPGGGFPVGPGDPTGTGVSTERQEQIDAARAAQQSLLSDIIANNDKMKRLIDNTKLFGFTAENSSGRASNALKGFGEEAITLGGELKNAFSSIFGSLEDALVGFVTTGKLDFKSLINSIIADLARMVIRMLIIKPLMGFFGGFFGGAFGFSGGGSVGNAFGLPGLAGGGLVSDDPAVPQRFAIGGRVSGPGTGVSDSVSALLSRDEFVVNAAASRPNMAGLEYLNQTGRMPGNGNVTSVSYSPNVNVTVEGNSANAAGDGAQIAKDMEQQMRAQFNEFVAQEQKPGGAFSKTNEDVL